MPLWMNAAGAILVPSDYEGFGLVAVEALACDVPVLSTPVGIAPALLDEVDGCLSAPFDASEWAALARSHLDGEGRVAGRDSAMRFSARRLAERVAAAYEDLADGPGGRAADLS